MVRNCFNCAWGGDGEEVNDYGHCYKHNGENDYIQPKKEDGCSEWKQKEFGECCETCALKLCIEKLDYSKGGCEHSFPEGFICLALKSDGVAGWMVGQDPETGMCECYIPKAGPIKIAMEPFGDARIARIVGHMREEIHERTIRNIRQP